MTTFVFCLEEPSAREMLKGVLPRMLPEFIDVVYLVFEGKQDLEKQLERRLKGWMRPDSCFVVMRDQDSGNCVSIKEKLSELCCRAGKPEAVVRIACRELESFYLGDFVAVEKGLRLSGLVKREAGKSKFRDPDRLGNPSEELIKVTRKHYQKVSGSRAIGPHLSLEDNRSTSFNALVRGITRLSAQT
ncbi:DUF4276 family protein [Desulfoluna sp.]|uniref:DUF4276 family protein n=1 Tax=Desulfoluna sp. TaxID=2045199 RepID=UPI002632640D|nr:DUF4276 family protein [Desulfoluna sp.]